MSKIFIKANEGLKEIEIPCMKCNKNVKVWVSTCFKGKMRKFCSACKQNFSISIFDSSLNDGCRRVGLK